MTPKLKTLLLQGARLAGGYDPDRIMSFIEADLTLAECHEVEGFLKWVYENKRTYGTGTIDSLWDEAKELS